jgi:regulation of enolase protein 1 (concanavalin A-like superfamily)
MINSAVIGMSVMLAWVPAVYGAGMTTTAGTGTGAAASDEVVLDGLPGALRWQLAPVSWGRTAPDGVAVTAGPGTDLFVDPAGSAAQLSAPRALLPVVGDYRFSARVSCGSAATFDAAVLLAWVAADRWVKLCLERSPAGVMTVVSVVTRGVSDDANGWPVPSGSTWLRVSRRGAATALHASADGGRWELVRHCAFDDGEPVQVGLLAQSPTGAGAVSRFEQVRFAPTGVEDIRGGE